ncbi:hypothetical protein ACIQ7S_24740 [Streptomyces griseoluteus]|uniref:hypothetical protein n=1 Tax=Streptomyces griseoluteus TaxID=29306 RepID=UPI003333E556
MLTEEDARRLVLAEIDAVPGRLEYDLEIHRVEAVPFGWIFSWGVSPWPARSPTTDADCAARPTPGTWRLRGDRPQR